MKTKLSKCLLFFIFSFGLFVTTASAQYPYHSRCGWVSGYWWGGYWHPGHRACVGGSGPAWRWQWGDGPSWRHGWRSGHGCRVVSGYWRFGYWHPARRVCW